MKIFDAETNNVTSNSSFVDFDEARIFVWGDWTGSPTMTLENRNAN